MRKLFQENFNDILPFFRVQAVPMHKSNEHKRTSVIRKPTFSLGLTQDSTLRRGPAFSDFDDNEIPLCESIEKMICPTSGRNEHGDELFIFNNLGQEYKQCVRVLVCSNTEAECHDYASFRNGYKSRCKQQNIFFELFSLTQDGKPSKDRFPFPAACSCVIERSLKVLS